MLQFQILEINDNICLDHAVLNCEGIINGVEAIPGEFPYMVSLRNESGTHYCGGSLVTRQHVVTAAHCLFTDKSVFYGRIEERYPPENITVIIDTISSGWYPGKSYAVEKTTPHSNYNIKNFSSLLYDIGIITVSIHVYNSVKKPPFAMRLKFMATQSMSNLVYISVWPSCDGSLKS